MNTEDEGSKLVRTTADVFHLEKVILNDRLIGTKVLQPFIESTLGLECFSLFLKPDDTYDLRGCHHDPDLFYIRTALLSAAKSSLEHLQIIRHDQDSVDDYGDSTDPEAEDYWPDQKFIEIEMTLRNGERVQRHRRADFATAFENSDSFTGSL